jgi:tetratricopeptide (TPR) repeat protein
MFPVGTAYRARFAHHKVGITLTKAVATKSSAESNLSTDSRNHTDLEEYCFVWTVEMLSEDDFESTEETLNSARSTEAMLQAPSAKERINAARSLIKRHPDCGLPYLIFARDGEAAEKTLGYEEALETSEEDAAMLGQSAHFQSLLDWYDEVPYAFEPLGVGYVAAEFARLLWEEKRHDEAITCLSPHLQQLQEDGSYLQAILVSYLILINEEEKASALLNQMPLPSPEWYYSKALLLFKQQGDTDVSRSALKLALSTNRAMSHVILTKVVAETTELTATEFEAIRFGADVVRVADARFVVDASVGWHTTPGAIEWLKPLSHKEVPLSAKQQMANPKFVSRYKLWKTNFEIADAQIERGNLKEAKKNARLAFKEARRAGFISKALFDSIEQLIDIAEDYDNSYSEIAECIQELLKERSSIENKEEARFIAAKIAEFCQRIHHDELALKLLDEEITITEKLLEVNEPSVCLHNLAEAFLSKGSSFVYLERWQEAISSLERSLDLQERYLGTDHPELLLSLSLLSQCLTKTGEIEKAEKTDARLKAIQLAFLGEETETNNENDEL